MKSLASQPKAVLGWGRPCHRGFGDRDWVRYGHVSELNKDSEESDRTEH